MCKTRAKFIVVLDTSLFGTEARGTVAFQPQGMNPVASVCEREGPEWPFDSVQIWGWSAGKGQACHLTPSVGLGPGPLSLFWPPWSLQASLRMPGFG